MSGHSKWSTIKRKKGANDAKRGKIFTKIIREITVAARDGGGDESANVRLRSAVQNAKAANMPLSTIERAVKRGTGEEEGAVYEEGLYEGYGPGGVAIIVETLTDNRNRTVSEVRHAFTKMNGNLGESGSVAWMFEQKGVLEVTKENIPEDDLMIEDAIATANTNKRKDMKKKTKITLRRQEKKVKKMRAKTAQSPNNTKAQKGVKL